MKCNLSALPATKLCSATAFSAAVGFSPLAMGASPFVKVDGSSTVYPIAEAVAHDFQRAKLLEALMHGS
jgi:ABC-type phosphate transport system substrate-binding protein